MFEYSILTGKWNADIEMEEWGKRKNVLWISTINRSGTENIYMYPFLFPVIHWLRGMWWCGYMVLLLLFNFIWKLTLFWPIKEWLQMIKNPVNIVPAC
jgi:hypothetical protein